MTPKPELTVSTIHATFVLNTFPSEAIQITFQAHFQLLVGALGFESLHSDVRVLHSDHLARFFHLDVNVLLG